MKPGCWAEVKRGEFGEASQQRLRSFATLAPLDLLPAAEKVECIRAYVERARTQRSTAPGEGVSYCGAFELSQHLRPLMVTPSVCAHWLSRDLILRCRFPRVLGTPSAV
jgi:hypothetical protein